MIESPMHISNAAITTVPGASATVILWDSTADIMTGVTLGRRRGFPRLARATIRIFADQVVTFFAEDLAKISTTWRPYNAAAGEATTINTWFERNVLLESDDHRFRVVTVTAPTVWEVSVKFWTEAALAQ